MHTYEEDRRDSKILEQQVQKNQIWFSSIPTWEDYVRNRQGRLNSSFEELDAFHRASVSNEPAEATHGVIFILLAKVHLIPWFISPYFCSGLLQVVILFENEIEKTYMRPVTEAWPALCILLNAYMPHSGSLTIICQEKCTSPIYRNDNSLE